MIEVSFKVIQMYLDNMTSKCLMEKRLIKEGEYTQILTVYVRPW